MGQPAGGETYYPGKPPSPMSVEVVYGPQEGNPDLGYYDGPPPGVSEEAWGDWNARQELAAAMQPDTGAWLEELALPDSQLPFGHGEGGKTL